MSIITYGLDPIYSKMITSGYGLEIEVEVIVTEIPHLGGGRPYRPKRRKITIKFKTTEETEFQFVEFYEDDDEDLMDKDDLKILFNNVKNKQDLKIFIIDNVKETSNSNGFKFKIKDGEINET